jgi:hypothetical protein
LNNGGQYFHFANIFADFMAKKIGVWAQIETICTGKGDHNIFVENRPKSPKIITITLMP